MTEDLMVAATARERLLAGAPAVERMIEAAGISTAVLEGGSGDPLLLLHGPGEHVAKWIEVLPSLVTTNRVIAPDLPGHGSTGSGGGPLTAARVLDWLEGVITATCATPPTVVGQIVGGAIAARYAADHGDRVARLVLVDALGLAPFHPTPEFGAALTAYLEGPDEATFDGLMHRCAYDYRRLRGWMGGRWPTLVDYTLDRVRARGGREALGALMAEFGVPAIPPATLAKISVPVTLIWGRHDLATDVRVAEAASARYGWPLHIIDECADDPVLEQPERFLAALRRH